MKPMSDKRLKKIVAMRAAITKPPPWAIDFSEIHANGYPIVAAIPVYGAFEWCDAELEIEESDAAFIVAAPAIVDELVDEVKRLQSRNAALVALVRRMEWGPNFVNQCMFCGGKGPMIPGPYRMIEGHDTCCPVATEINRLCNKEVE